MIISEMTTFLSILTLLVFPLFGFSAEDYTYKIRGLVFHDVNGNGFREGGEEGVGGVIFHFSSGEEVFTDEYGRFLIEIKTWQAPLKLQIDEDSLPAGSVMTTATTAALDPALGSLRELSFALKFPEKKVHLAESGAAAHVEVVKETQGLVMQKLQDQFLIQGDLWQNYQSANVLKGLVKIPFSYTAAPFQIQLAELEKFLNQDYSLVRSFEVILPEDLSLEFRALLQREIQLLLVQKNYIGPTPQFKVDRQSSALIVLDLQELKDECVVQVDQKKILVSEKQKLQLPLLQTGEGEIFCLGRKGHFAFERLVPLGEKFIEEVPVPNYIDLYMPFYLEEGSASINHFRGQTDLKELQVNGEKLEIKQGRFYYNHLGSKGINKLDFLSGEKKYRFEYPLFYGHRFSFQTRLQMLWKNSRTNNYNTSYNLSALNQYALDMDYFWSPFWGIQGSYAEDVLESNVENIDRSTVKAKHSRYAVHGLWRFNLHPSEFRSTELTFGLGWGGQKFNPGSLSKIRYMDDFHGVHARFQALFSEVSRESLDIQLFSDAQLTSDVKGGQAILVGSEFRWWLNKSLGRLFGIEPYYNRYYRYGSVQNIKLTTGLMYEVARAKTANADDAFTEDSSAWIYVGFLFPFY